MDSPAVATDLDLWRESFPYLRQRVYLDTAAAGLCWRGHGEAVARFYDEVKNRGYDARPEWYEVTERVRGRLASWLGVGKSDLTLLSNTTEALNLAAHSLRLQPGDRIVLAADEFPSVERVWLAAQRAGAVVVAVKIDREQDRQAALLAALEPRAKLLVVSQTHSSTGTTLDLARIGRRCRELGMLFMVDGIQALGAVPTDLSQVDIYAASFFKWMLSGFGVGVLVTSPQARQMMEPAYRGYANRDDSTQLQYAHVNVPAIYGLDATLDFFEGIGWDRVFQRVRELGDHLIEGAARRRLDLVTPADMRAGIFVFRFDNGELTRQRLADRGISVSARGAGVRVAPHFYNTREEVDQCLNALAEPSA